MWLSERLAKPQMRFPERRSRRGVRRFGLAPEVESLGAGDGLDVRVVE